MPWTENVAVVESAPALPNVTVPGPLTLLHVVVRPRPGRPSSVAVPVSETSLSGSVIV